MEGGRFVHVDRNISLVVQPTISSQEVSTLVEHVEKLHVLTASTITCQNWKPFSTNHGNINSANIGRNSTPGERQHTKDT